MTKHTHLTKIKKWPPMKLGMKKKCPKCGDAPLFRAYLKQVEECANIWH